METTGGLRVALAGTGLIKKVMDAKVLCRLTFVKFAYWGADLRMRLGKSGG